MLGSGRAQSSQPCPSRPSGVPWQEQRGPGAAVPCQAVPCQGSCGRHGRSCPAAGSGEVLGQDAVCWVRVGLSCPPDHFLPYLGNLDFLLPFVPYFSLVKLSLVLLETAAGAGPGERAGGSGCFSSLAAHAPAAELALLKWHPAVQSPRCWGVLRGELYSPVCSWLSLGTEGMAEGERYNAWSTLCPAWLVLGSDLPCPQDTEWAVSP